MRTQKSIQTQQQIILSYLQLIRTKKWDKISVIEICRKAEVTRGTFYQYFGDIYELMEQLEQMLLDDLKVRFEACPKIRYTAKDMEKFPEQFDCAPPENFLVWFDFCKQYREAMLALLDRKYGDTYFVKQLKDIIREQIESMMDREGIAKDELREHFIRICVELHLLSAQTWLSAESGEFLSIDEIVNLLNTMRIGSMFMNWRQKKDQ